MMMILKVFFGVIFFLGAFSTRALATNKRCLERLLAQITTLREEIKAVIPVGTILPYAGAQALPRGYILCDGALLDRATYPRLFETIGLTFTPPQEQGGTQFRLPNLGGKTLVGTQDTIALGREWGSEFQRLAVENLPPHQHDGITGPNDKDHTHSGQTGHDYPDHLHAYLRHNQELIPLFNGLHLNHSGSHHPISRLGESWHHTQGATSRHQHNFTTGDQSQAHQHPFTTNDGSANGLATREFSVMQPSIGLRFMIKAL